MAIPAVITPSLQIYRGDSFEKTFTLNYRDSITGALTPVNLTLYGNEWEAQLRASEDSTEWVTQFIVDDSNADTGVIILKLTPELSADLPNKGVWDVQVTDTTANPPFVSTLLRGTFTRIKDVTR